MAFWSRNRSLVFFFFNLTAWREAQSRFTLERTGIPPLWVIEKQ
jgi:hypothetical protein